MQSLMGKAAIVAGASSGMGRAIAMALATDGMWVMAAARREEKLAELGGRNRNACGGRDRP